jgi:hypothetical protein
MASPEYRCAADAPSVSRSRWPAASAGSVVDLPLCRSPVTCSGPFRPLSWPVLRASRTVVIGCGQGRIETQTETLIAARRSPVAGPTRRGRPFVPNSAHDGQRAPEAPNLGHCLPGVVGTVHAGCCTPLLYSLGGRPAGRGLEIRWIAVSIKWHRWLGPAVRMPLEIAVERVHGVATATCLRRTIPG